MSNFRVGQKVVCVKRDSWKTVFGQQNICNDPVFNKIYTVSDLEEFEGNTFLSFEELSPYGSWGSKNFKPLQLDHEFVEEIIKQVTPKEELA